MWKSGNWKIVEKLWFQVYLFHKPFFTNLFSQNYFPKTIFPKPVFSQNLLFYQRVIAAAAQTASFGGIQLTKQLLCKPLWFWYRIWCSHLCQQEGSVFNFFRTCIHTHLELLNNQRSHLVSLPKSVVIQHRLYQLFASWLENHDKI